MFDAPTLFAEGGEHLDGDRYARCRGQLRSAGQKLPRQPVSPALYNAALSYEGAWPLQRRGRALPPHPLMSTATANSQRRCFAWAPATPRPAAGSPPADLRPGRKAPDLTLSDRVEATTRLGLAHFELSDLAVAEQHFGQTIEQWKNHRDTERLESDFFLAMSHFYLAHIAHKRFQVTPVRLPQQQLERDLEAKARAFLMRRPSTSRRSRSKTRAGHGFRIPRRDALPGCTTPWPSAAAAELNSADKRVIYDLLLRDKLRVLLEKGQGHLGKERQHGRARRGEKRLGRAL